MKVDIEIRFTDVDSQNHVNHTAIVAWIAHARVKLIDEKISQYNLEPVAAAKFRERLDHVLVNLEVNFHKEIFYPGTIEVSSRVLNVGNKSLTTEFFVYSNDDDLVAEAQCINVFFRTSDKKSVIIPDKLKDLLMKIPS